MIFLLFIVLSPAYLYSQSVASEGYPPARNVRYERRVLNKFKRMDCYDKKENYNVLVIYWLSWTDPIEKAYGNDEYPYFTIPPKEVYVNYLLNSLKYHHRFGRHTFYTSIYNDSLKVCGTSDNFMHMYSKIK